MAISETGCIGREEVKLWNLDFTYLGPMFSSIVHTFYQYAVSSVREHYICLECIFVLSTQFPDYVFKLSVIWRVAAVLSIFNWKLGRKIDFQL